MKHKWVRFVQFTHLDLSTSFILSSGVFELWNLMSVSLFLLFLFLALLPVCLFSPFNRTATILATATLLPSWSTTFNVDPDTHIDSIEQAEAAVLEGTANWSAKIAVTGRHYPISNSNEMDAISRWFQSFLKAFIFPNCLNILAVH